VLCELVVRDIELPAEKFGITGIAKQGELANKKRLINKRRIIRFRLNL